MATTTVHRRALAVADYMTREPCTIGPEQTLEQAHRLMRREHIRHLPVVARGGLVGIISQRDLMLIETLPDVDPSEVPVEDAMIAKVFVVAPNEPLGAVAGEMARRKLGAAVVMERGRVVGLFTATDACRALAEVVGEAPPRRRSPAPTRSHSRASAPRPV
jgi:acetoin utilization protein AcuB